MLAIFKRATLLALGLATATGLCFPPKPKRKSQRRPNVSAFVTASRPFIATGCDESLWGHVYHPKRLVKIQKCISVTGTIYYKKREADGDDHIQLKLDDQYRALLNARNETAQKGCLVLESVCQHTVKQSDANAACQDFQSGVNVPRTKSHVRVVGSYVLGTGKPGHGWMEIHPVTSIKVVR